MPKRELLTLEQVKDEVDLRDYKTSTPIDLSRKRNYFEHDGDDFVLVSSGKDRRITKGGMANLMHILNLPSALPKKLETHPDIVKNVVNEVCKRNGAYLRTLSKRNSVVSFVDTDQTLVSNGEILEAAKSALKKPLFDMASIDENGVGNFTIVSETKEKLNIGKDDRFLGGVRIENNPLRASSTKIEAYLERLVCLNGAISTQAHWAAPRNMDSEVKEWLVTSMGSAVKESNNMFASIAKLSDKKIDANMMDFLENMYDQLKVPEKARDLITRRVVKEGADTLYDLFNHITYVASNYRAIRDDVDLSARLMAIGGHFSEHIEEICRACNRPAFAVTE